MKPDTLNSYQERMARILVHIANHLDEPIPLEELARVANFSPYHFHRIFRGMVGESVKEHVRRLRLERAAQRLRATDQAVLAIALDAGYESHESFTRAFANLFGMPPSEFRENQAARAELRRSAAPEGGAPMEVEIRKLEKLRVAFVRHVGPYDQVGQAWQKLMQWAGSRGLLGPNMRLLGIVLDDPEITPPDKLRYDAALVVGDAIAGSGEIGVQEVGPGEYAVGLHVGPYHTLGESYARLCGEWLPASGRELRTAPALEFYLNSPMFTPPDRLRTEIWLPC